MNRTLLSLLLLAGALHQAAAARSPGLFQVIFPPMPGTVRLMGVELHIASGRIAALQDCPPGWQIEVDNDAAWHATLNAHATIGAAAIDSGALRRLILLAAAPSTVAATLGGPLTVEGSVTMMQQGGLTSIDLHGLRLTSAIE